MQAIHEVPLARGGLGRAGAKQVAGLLDAQVVAGQLGHLCEVVVQLDAFANQRDLFGIVELETERARRHRCGQAAQRRSLLEYDAA